MQIADHIESFRCVDRTLVKLDAVRLPEVWIWTALTAATHLVNAALHAEGVTIAEDYLPTQVVGLYVPTDGAIDGTGHDVRPPGDILHVDLPVLDQPIPDVMGEIFTSLRVLEDMREPAIRGADAIDGAAIGRCGEAYARVVALCGDVLGLSAEGPYMRTDRS